MGKKKQRDEVPDGASQVDERALAVIEPDGDKGVQTKLVLMSKSKPTTPGKWLSDEEANVNWVFKQMTPPKPPVPGEEPADLKPNVHWEVKQMDPRSGRGRRKPAPSIGSMQVPGKR